MRIVMDATTPIKANTDLWSAYLTQEWEGWIGATHLGTTQAAQRTARIIAAACAPWLTFVTQPRPLERVR